MWLFWDNKIQCVPKTKITRMTYYCKVLMTRLDTQTNHKVIFRGGESDKLLLPKTEFPFQVSNQLCTFKIANIYVNAVRM